MRHPRLAAVVERRLLINYRADPDVVAPLLPDGLRPQLVDGAAVVGVCFMRLGRLRPSGLRARGRRAAHRPVGHRAGDGRARRVHVLRRPRALPAGIGRAGLRPGHAPGAGDLGPGRDA